MSAPVSGTAQLMRFLVVGGSAAAINWLLRFPLVLIMPQEWAVLLAYAVGMSVGFTLYRRFVFPGSDRPVGEQAMIFVVVNLVGAVVVLTTTLILVAMLTPLTVPDFVHEGLAHGTAIGLGAVINFLGHRSLTFRRPAMREAAPNPAAAE